MDLVHAALLGTLRAVARCGETVPIGGRIVDSSRLFVRPSARMSNQSFSQPVSQLISQNTGLMSGLHRATPIWQRTQKSTKYDESLNKPG